MDRFHGFIEGWKLIRVNEDLIVKGFTLNVEYFSEILHTLRSAPKYSFVVSELINIPKGADKRDINAVVKLTSAYLKLIFPHVENPEDINKDDFLNFCLTPAIEKRQIVRKQISLIDPEFKEDLPGIKVK